MGELGAQGAKKLRPLLGSGVLQKFRALRFHFTSGSCTMHIKQIRCKQIYIDLQNSIM